MADQPRIISRRDWGAARAIPAGRNVPLSSRRMFVAHWPVMTQRDERQWMRDIERIHLNQGWFGIGYNYCVGSQIYEGCGLMTRGVHAGNAGNVPGFGVCFLQSSDARGQNRGPLTQQMRNNGRALYEWLSARAWRRLQMTTHGALMSTMCPGPDIAAWVRAGMPASGPATSLPQPPPQAEQEDLMASAMSQNGTTMLFMLFGGWAWDRWQRPGETDWLPAGGWRRFARAQNAVAIDAFTTRAGHVHVQVRNRDGSVDRTWQRAGQTGWQGGQAGQAVATLQRWTNAPR